MAYIVNSTQTAEATAATYTVTLGAHAANDLLLVFLTQDVGTSAITTASSGWAMIGTGAASGGVRSQWAYKVAASGAEANPTFSGTTDEWIGTCFVIRDADPSTPFGSLVDGTDFKRSDYASASTSASGALTSATDGALLLYAWSADGNTRYIKTKLSDLVSIDKYTTSNVCHVVGMRQQQTAGAASTVTAYLNSATGGNCWVLAVRNKSGGALAPDLRVTNNELRWYGSWATTYDATTTWQSPSNFAASINSINCSTTAATVSTNGLVGSTWGNATTLAHANSTTGEWVGGTHAITSTDMSGQVFTLQWTQNSSASQTWVGAEGVIVAFSDGTNWAAYQLASKSKGWFVSSAGTQTAAIALGSAALYASSGSINWAAVTRIGYFIHRTGSSTSSNTFLIKNAILFSACALTGGGSSRPSKFVDFNTLINGWSNYKLSFLQASAQVMPLVSVQIGDGTNTTYFDSSASSMEFPSAYSLTQVDNWQQDWNFNSGAAYLKVKAGSSDTINLAAGVCATDTAQDLTIDAASSTSATYSFAQSWVGWKAPTWKTGVNVSSATFVECGEIDAKGSDWTDCTIKTTTSTDAAIAFSEDGGSMTRCTIDVTGTSAAYHLELGTATTAITLADVTFTGTPATDKVHVRKTTGTVTITISGTTTLVAGDVTTEGATVSIVAPTTYRGQNFTGLVAGSKVKVFTSGTQTVLYGTDSSGTSFSWDDSTSGDVTVDYTVQQAGYLPIRVTGVTISGNSTAVTTTPISQVVDRAYVASSGLTYGTTAVVTVGTNPTTAPGTKTFTLSTASTGQNWYSFWIEQWIDKGDTGEALANVAFPLQANGPNSFTLLNGWEFSDGATSIAYLSRDGIRYVNAAGTRTAAWAAILTAGVPSGARVRYQQSDGGTTGSAVVTSGNMDELVAIYGDASHGNFDYTGYLVLKVQEMGYDQAEADVYATYGTLEDQLYVVGLAPTANTVATGNPSLASPPTITDHAGSPVTWNSKAFSITIEDSAAGNSGTNIMRWLRYYFETGGEFPAASGVDAFDWHDLVQQNGDSFKTVRGKVYGDVGASLKGVRVITNGTTNPHADFSLFTADDGTTYTPPQAASVTITGLTSGSRVQIYDTANSVELFNDIVAATSKVYSETYSVDRTIRVRITYVSGATAYNMIEATVGDITTSSYDISYVASQSADDVYDTNAIDGSTVTNVTINDTTDRVEIAIAGGAVTWASIYAYQVYWLNTEEGIRDDFAFISAPDTANYILTGFKIKNTHATNPLTITGGWGRDASTGLSSTIIDTTSTANVYLAPDHVIPYSTGSGLTAGQDAALTAINSAVTSYLDAPITGVPDAVHDEVVEGTTTLRQSIRLHNSVLLGKVSGAGTGTESFRDLADSKNRVVSTVDSSGNRSAVTLDGA